MGSVVDVLAADADVLHHPDAAFGREPVAGDPGRPPTSAPQSLTVPAKRRLPEEDTPPAAACSRLPGGFCRDLFGRPVAMPTPSKAPRRGFRPWSKLEPSDIDHLTKDEIYHYERELGLSAWRSRTERLARLEKLAQTNTLPHQPRAALEGECQQLDSLQDFLARPAAERCRVTGAELKRLERLAFIVDNELLGFAERRKRLLDQLWAAREAASSRDRSGQQASLLAAWGLAPKKPSGVQDVEAEAAPTKSEALAPAVELVAAGTGIAGVSVAKLAGALGIAGCQMDIIDVPFD